VSTETVVNGAASATSSVGGLSDALHLYGNILLVREKDIEFLYGDGFSRALRLPAQRIAHSSTIKLGEVTEEFIRFLALKIYTGDRYDENISPKALSRFMTTSPG
jgi:hypothetical protein